MRHFIVIGEGVGLPLSTKYVFDEYWCRNGVQQRLDSWQDGVSGTNCPIQPGKNWTYVFQVKDQIGTFYYFPSKNFQRASGGFGPLRINNRIVIKVPFPKLEAEFDDLIGDWYQQSYKYKDVRKATYHIQPRLMLMNGKGSFLYPLAKVHENFTVSQSKKLVYVSRLSE
ncbi:monocopper oxidase SKU5 [Olea europaea subsp. europaea]|uniref:Monocopper oxidase SKU5 n=1 Tax=Olea europaea subsp. europaea TaxID=158383 RepID=A0A8S0VAI7_OLEEU|nr:monocopper oxidase SKU5 [Olea europaea subsp. europaea]